MGPLRVLGPATVLPCVSPTWFPSIQSRPMNGQATYHLTPSPHPAPHSLTCFSAPRASSSAMGPRSLSSLASEPPPTSSWKMNTL